MGFPLIYVIYVSLQEANHTKIKHASPKSSHHCPFSIKQSNWERLISHFQKWVLHSIYPHWLPLNKFIIIFPTTVAIWGYAKTHFWICPSIILLIICSHSIPWYIYIYSIYICSIRNDISTQTWPQLKKLIKHKFLFGWFFVTIELSYLPAVIIICLN